MSTEVTNMKQQGKLAFTEDEIYQFSRQDSIISNEINPNTKAVDELVQRIRYLEQKVQSLTLAN